MTDIDPFIREAAIGGRSDTALTATIDQVHAEALEELRKLGKGGAWLLVWVGKHEAGAPAPIGSLSGGDGSLGDFVLVAGVAHKVADKVAALAREQAQRALAEGLDDEAA